MCDHIVGKQTVAKLKKKTESDKTRTNNPPTTIGPSKWGHKNKFERGLGEIPNICGFGEGKELHWS